MICPELSSAIRKAQGLNYLALFIDPQLWSLAAVPTANSPQLQAFDCLSVVLGALSQSKPES